MDTLADQIERYLKRILSESAEGFVDIRRSDLAESFMCVPSQINYVLETRFSNQHGYHVESRRGGGGYIRIIKLNLNTEEDLSSLMESANGKMVSEHLGNILVERLLGEEFLTRREAAIIKCFITNQVLSPEEEESNLLRGRMLNALLLNLLREDWD